MTSQQASITVQQYENYNVQPVTAWYKVVQAVNTTDPTIGERLTKSAVDALIAAGVKVTIKADA